MKTSTKISTKTKLKARRMWANYYPNGDCPTFYTRKKLAQSMAYGDTTESGVHVAVIPLDDVDKLVAKACIAYWDNAELGAGDAMSAALVAIGVLPKQRKGRK